MIGGTLSFAVQLRGFLGRMLSGSEKASWVAFFIDNDNHLLFESQDRSLTAYQVVGGHRLEAGRLALLKGGNKVQIRLTADRVLQRVGQSGPLELVAPDNLRGGTFGFKPPITIREFVFEARVGEGLR